MAFLLPAVLMACSDIVTEPEAAPDAPVLTTMTASQTAMANRVVQKITGSGHYTSPEISQSPNMRRVFTMNALKLADGTVKGNFNLRLHVPGEEAPDKSSGTITCFTVMDNVAWIGGHMDGEDPPDVVWQVVDNGQGSGAEPDEIGLMFGPFMFPTLFDAGFAQDFCDETPEGIDFGGDYGWLPLFVLRSAVEDGNIQIK